MSQIRNTALFKHRLSSILTFRELLCVLDNSLKEPAVTNTGPVVDTPGTRGHSPSGFPSPPTPSVPSQRRGSWARGSWARVPRPAYGSPAAVSPLASAGCSRRAADSVQYFIMTYLTLQCCGSDPNPDPDPPDPHVFGPPRSGSISQSYGSGSGSFYNHGKIVRKILIPTIL